MHKRNAEDPHIHWIFRLFTQAISVRKCFLLNFASFFMREKLWKTTKKGTFSFLYTSYFGCLEVFICFFYPLCMKLFTKHRKNVFLLSFSQAISTTFDEVVIIYSVEKWASADTLCVKCRENKVKKQDFSCVCSSYFWRDYKLHS